MRQQQYTSFHVRIVAPLSLVAVGRRVFTRHALTPRIVSKMCQQQTVIVHQVRGVALRVKLVASDIVDQQAVRAKHYPGHGVARTSIVAKAGTRLQALLRGWGEKMVLISCGDYPSTTPTASRTVYVPSRIISIPRARSSLASRRASNTREKPRRAASRTRCSV